MHRFRLPALLFVIILSIGSPASGQGMPPTLVETDVVQSMEFHNQVTLVGRTRALSRSQIVAEVTGKVVSIDAAEGNPVGVGDRLVSIDARQTQYMLDAKRAEVAQAKAQAELEEKDLKRSKNLFDQELISEGHMDQDRADATRAREWYNQKLAEQKQLELNLKNCSIRAPYDGFTALKLVDVGEWVNPGTPVYQMVDLSTVTVTVDLPERYFGQVSMGTSVSITVSGDVANPVSGIVTGVAPNASEETHTFPVIVAVDNSDRRLGGGMLVRTTLSINKVFSSLSVSKDAIVRQGPQTMVYTIVDGAATPIPVQTSSSNGKMIAVQGEGLVEGMVVVVRGNERIFPGSPVRVAGEEGGQDAPPAEAGDEAATSSDNEESAKSE